MQNETVLPAHSGPITINGAYALTPLVGVWISEYQKTHPEVSFELNPMGSGKGLAEVLQGKTELALVSSDIQKDVDSLLWVFPVARIAVVPVINRNNPYVAEILKRGMTRDDLARIFSANERMNWGDLFGNPGKDPIHVYIRTDAAGATDVMARFLWLQAGDFRGNGIEGEDLLITGVKKDPLALGYCNFIYSFDPDLHEFYPEISIVPLDLNNNRRIEPKENFYDSVATLQRAMWIGKYPCSLTRDLFIVSKTKPGTKEVVDFIQWILSEGQRYIAGMGYVELHSSEIKNMLDALK